MKLWKPGEKITAAGLNAMQENRRERKSLNDSFPLAVPLNTEVMLPDEKMYSWGEPGYYTVRGSDWKSDVNVYDTKVFVFNPEIYMYSNIKFPTFNISYPIGLYGKTYFRLFEYDRKDGNRSTVLISFKRKENL
jgi:hypothetical protein